MNALEHIHRIAESGQEVLAADHAAFATLIEAGIDDVGPQLVVARQRLITTELGSGSLHLMRVEHLSDAGAEALTQYMDNPTLGRIAHRIEADHPFTFRNRAITRQWTELAIEIDRDGTIGHDINASIPFDATMQEDTRQLWEQWGVALDYEVNQQGGRFGTVLLPDYAALTEHNLAAMQ